MAEITPFDLAGSLQAHNVLANQRLQQQNAQAEQNAFAQAVPMLQSDPQNAFATAARTSPNAALKLLPYIKQMDDQKRAALSRRTEALGKIAINVEQYKDPAVRKAVALSMLPQLPDITPDDIQRGDWTDNGVTTLKNLPRTVDQMIAQSNLDRTYQAGRTDHADTVTYQNKNLARQDAMLSETIRSHKADEAQKAADAGVGGGLEDAAKVNAAVRFNLTGQLPAFGMGKAALKDRQDVMNYAAKLATGKYTPEQLVANIAGFKANSSSLTQQTKQFNAIEQAANSAKNSANLALQAADKGGAGPTGSPAINRWIQAGRQEIAGDQNVIDLNNHLNTFTEEYAKVMTGATGSQAATDSARNTAKERISKANSASQLRGIITEMNKEMGGKHYAMRAQIGSINNQLAGHDYAEPQGVQTASPAPAPVSAAGWSNFKVHN